MTVRTGERADGVAVAGRIFILASTIALAVASIAASLRPRGLGIVASASAWQATLCAAVAIAGMLAIARRSWVLPIATCVFAWAVAAMLVANEVPWSGVESATLVAPAERLLVTVALAAAGGMGVITSAARNALPAFAAGALALFGCVQLLHVADIAELLPRFMPLRNAIPFASGATLLACGIATAFPRSRAMGGWLVAGLFLSWIPLVHAPRLMDRPGSLSEWQFALTALALAGVMLVLTGQATHPLSTRRIGSAISDGELT